MNELTRRLLAEGYTKDNHPDYVEWSNWKDFEYTREALKQMVWETPCGLQKLGCGYEHGSHLGVDYCPENDNPRFGCPYRDEVPCSHRFENAPMGWNCVCHQVVCEYDYNHSIERLDKQWDEMEHEAWMETMAPYGYCDCLRWDFRSRSYIPMYDIDRCIHSGCENEVCAITKKKRNLQKVNIYYDILREHHTRKGLFEDVQRNLEKGVRKFDKRIARTDAEIYLKLHKDDFADGSRKTRDDRQLEFFSEFHGETGFNGYDYYMYYYTVRNIRIECRESRDLRQDLADISEGIEVVHSSDKVKRKAQEKRDRKEKRQKQKAARHERDNIRKWVAWLQDDEVSDNLKNHARTELSRRGLDERGQPDGIAPPEQFVLYPEDAA